MYLFQLQYSQGTCPVVGLLGQMVDSLNSIFIANARNSSKNLF